uniref:Uncharacterized protein n=1 Tax=Manihot esculenta TaxID=3983 RepID=A0A2C9V4M1_MANES
MSETWMMAAVWRRLCWLVVVLFGEGRRRYCGTQSV